ncbi:protein phosphatase [Sagittula sp. NFXS13]|uniref:protein phosphatase n=1 Tax=Sagittula sp. NFXS13 TaxID=2819095 RepID=UPI0032DE7C0A
MSSNSSQIARENGEAVVMHALPVSGGIVVFSSLPGTGGDYHGDLDHLASWRPALVICIATPAELVAAGSHGLSQDVQDKGSRWVHLDVSNDDDPATTLRTTWPQVSAQARRALLGGGRVMLHAPDGSGLCSMVLLRLMIEAGDAPDEAQDRLRSFFPQTIADSRQLDWALQADRGAVPFVRHGGRA